MDGQFADHFVNDACIKEPFADLVVASAEEKHIVCPLKLVARNIAKKLDIHSPSGLTIYAIVNNLVDIKEIKL